MTEKKTTLEILQDRIAATYGVNPQGVNLKLAFAVKFLCAQLDELKTELEDLKHKVKMDRPYMRGLL